MNDIITYLGNLYNIPSLDPENVERQNIFLTQIINEYKSTFFISLSFICFSLLSHLMNNCTIILSYCDMTTCTKYIFIVFFEPFLIKKYFHFEMTEILSINIFTYISICLVRAIKKCCLFSKTGFKPGQSLLHLADYSEHCLCMEMKLRLFSSGVK